MVTTLARNRLIGAEAPRLWTPPASALTAESSDGGRVIEFAERLGVELMPWQRWALWHGLELRPEGGYRFRTVLVLVSRQNGKSSIAQVLSLWRMMNGARLVLGTSTSLETARESWLMAVELAEDRIPDAVASVKRGALDTSLTLANHARYKVAAANRRGGRGLSVDLGIADELREHQSWDAWGALSGATAARPDPQIWGFSNAGDDTSVVLNHLRGAALAYIETGEGDDSLGLFEWSAEDGCDLDDRAAWAQANPALGHTITEATLESKLASSPPAVFRTEHLCQNVQVLDAAVDMAAWRESADAGTLDALRDRVALAIDVSLDLAHVTLVAAALTDDGRVRAEVVAAWNGVNAARAALPDWMARVKPRVLTWFPGGPGATLATDLRGVPRALPIKGEDVSGVCMRLAEQILGRRVLHSGDPLLMAQLGQATRLSMGDGWRFGRRGPGHVDAVYALAGAVHAARTVSVVGKPRLIVSTDV